MFLGIISGNGSAALTLVPALVAAAGSIFICFSPRLLRALGQRGTDTEPHGLVGRAKVGLRRGLHAGADGIEQAILLLRSHSFGVIVGSLAYMAFDIAALGFAFAAVGQEPRSAR